MALGTGPTCKHHVHGMAAVCRAVGGDDVSTGMAGSTAAAGGSPGRGGYITADYVRVGVAGGGGTGSTCASFGLVQCCVANIGYVDVAIGVAVGQRRCGGCSSTGGVAGDTGDGMTGGIGMVAGSRTIGGDDISTGMAGGTAA